MVNINKNFSAKIAFYLESANKTVWNVTLGVGLAINMGSVVFGVFGTYVAGYCDFKYIFY